MMKCTIIITLLLLCSVCSIGQIKTLETAPRSMLFESVPYDSSMSFDPNSYQNRNISTFLGQEVYFLPSSNIPTRKLDIVEFYTFNTTSKRKKKTVKFEPTSLVYKDIVGTKFRIDSIFFDTLFLNPNSPKGKEFFFIKLVNKTYLNGLYFNIPYQFGDRHRVAVPFMLSAYFEYLRKFYIGNQYDFLLDDYTFKDAVTSEFFKPNKGDIWSCVDVTLMDILDYQYKEHTCYRPVLIFANEKGNKIPVDPMAIIRTTATKLSAFRKR